MALPKEIDIYIGLTNTDAVENEYGGVLPDTKLNAYVSSVGSKLARVSKDPSYPYQFKVLNSNVVNAFALPGGPVYINKGLLSLLKNESQVAGVLGHEIGHITNRHGIEQLERNIGGTVLLNAISGILKKKEGKSLTEDEINGLNKLGAGIVTLVNLGYSRDNEFEADASGLDYMYNAGYNPLGMTDVLKLLQSLEAREPTKFEVWMRTHPATSTRIKEVEDLIKKKYPLALSMTMGTEEHKEATKKPFYERPFVKTTITVLPFAFLGILLYQMFKAKKNPLSSPL
jgi:predicted Zn-dependent protease